MGLFRFLSFDEQRVVRERLDSFRQVMESSITFLDETFLALEDYLWALLHDGESR